MQKLTLHQQYYAMRYQAELAEAIKNTTAELTDAKAAIEVKNAFQSMFGDGMVQDIKNAGLAITYKKNFAVIHEATRHEDDDYLTIPINPKNLTWHCISCGIFDKHPIECLIKIIGDKFFDEEGFWELDAETNGLKQTLAAKQAELEALKQEIASTKP